MNPPSTPLPPDYLLSLSESPSSSCVTRLTAHAALYQQTAQRPYAQIAA